MRRLLAAMLCLTLVAVPAAAAPNRDPAELPAGSYRLDKDHGSLIVRVRHLGLTDYTFRFNRFDARFDWDPKAPGAARLTVEIDTASIDTGNPAADRRFAGDVLKAKAHPKATFTATGVTRADSGHGILTGDLTLGGVTKPVTLDIDYRGYEAGLLGRRAGFSATGRFKRSDFGLTAYDAFAADEVELIIEVEFLKT